MTFIYSLYLLLGKQMLFFYFIRGFLRRWMEPLPEPYPDCAHFFQLTGGHMAFAGQTFFTFFRRSPPGFDTIVRVIGHLERNPSFQDLFERQFLF
jgi:hypothetical protein